MRRDEIGAGAQPLGGDSLLVPERRFRTKRGERCGLPRDVGFDSDGEVDEKCAQSNQRDVCRAVANYPTVALNNSSLS